MTWQLINNYYIKTDNGMTITKAIGTPYPYGLYENDKAMQAIGYYETVDEAKRVAEMGGRG